MKKVVIALGGNALQARGEAATSENELKNVLVTARHIAEIIDEGYQVIISHGNGPQVGRILLQNEAGKNITPPMPMDCVVAARLADKGFNGPTDIYESTDGLLHAYSFHDHYDTKWITEDLGKKWIFASSSIKVYPCCRYSGGHLDACLEIVKKYHPDPAKIEKIFIRSSKQTLHLLAEPRKWDPKNIVDLQFSMPYQASAAFLHGKFGVAELDTALIEDPLIKKMIRNTEAVLDEEFENRYPDHYSSAVTITMGFIACVLVHWAAGILQ